MRKTGKRVAIEGCIILLRASFLRGRKSRGSYKSEKDEKMKKKKDYCFIEFRE
jgi:hypothetical protein